MATFGGAASTIFILFFLLSVYDLISSRSLGLERLSFFDKFGVALLLGFILVVLVGYINTVDTQQYWSRFERVLRAFGGAVIFLHLVSRDLKLIPAFEKGVLLGSAVVFVVAVTQIASSGQAGGAYNTILFGDFSAYLSCAAAAAAFTNRHRPLFACAFLLATGASAYACFLSGTRGAWIGLYFGLLAVQTLWLFTRFSRSQLAFAFFACLGAVLLAYLFSLHPTVSARNADAVQTFVQFFSGGDQNTSVGLRLQMWAAAYDMWMKNPVIGSGLGDYSLDLAEMIRLGNSSIGSHFGEAHSLYFEFLATTGVVGLAMMLACMFIFPSMLFMGSRRPGGIKNLINSPASLHGLCLILTFFCFGISQNWLGRSSITSVFFLLLALLWVDVVRERQNETRAREAPGL